MNWLVDIGALLLVLSIAWWFLPGQGATAAPPADPAGHRNGDDT